MSMLEPGQFYEALGGRGVRFFAGVPDSLLKDFCAYVTDNADPSVNVITANEGSAVALATGHYLATGEIPLVYMQNSGLGNTINPLTSLTDDDVYGIPMLMVVGWRGEPTKKMDAPQHVKMGKVTLPMLDSVDMPYAVLPDTMAEAEAVLDEALRVIRETSAPFTLVVPKGTFEGYKLQMKVETPYEMTREDAITSFLNVLDPDAMVVSTTGKPSRELFEVRRRLGQSHDRDFLTVGSMGHSSQIALGVAMARPDKAVYCLDGDGAALMHLGGFASIGAIAPKNYRHFLVNNAAHDSVGGQPTVGFDVDFRAIAAACGYKKVFIAESPAELDAVLPEFMASEGPVLLEARIAIGARKDLGRPTMTPKDLKEAFMASMK
jgi:phosphonopyruvate decarboxylase